MNQLISKNSKPDKMFIISSALFVVMFMVARGVLKELDLPLIIKLALCLCTVGAFIFFLIRFTKGVRELDELERRIQLEALAFAFPMTMVLLMLLGLLQLFIVLPEEDFSYRHIWAFLPAFYFGGIALARKRYS